MEGGREAGGEVEGRGEEGEGKELGKSSAGRGRKHLDKYILDRQDH